MEKNLCKNENVEVAKEVLTKFGKLYDSNIYLDDIKYFVTRDEDNVLKSFVIAKNIEELISVVENLNNINLRNLEIVEEDFVIKKESYFKESALSEIGRIGCNPIYLYRNYFLIGLESLTLNGDDVENCLVFDDICEAIESALEINNIRIFK